MRDKLKQIIDLLKMNWKINYKLILVLGVLSYVTIVMLVFLNPVITKMIFKVNYSLNMSDISGLIIAVSAFALIFNLSIGLFYIIKNFIKEKRYFYLLPFDLDVKIYSIYLYSFTWIILNAGIYFLLIIILGKNFNLLSNVNFLLFRINVMDIIPIGVMYLNVITYIIIYNFAKKNNFAVYNFIFLWLTTILENIFIKKLKYFLNYKNIYGTNQTLTVFGINLILLWLVLYFISKRQNIKG